MGLPNKDELEGKLDRAKGTIKKETGRVIDDPELENEGEVERTGGRVKEGIGKARRKVGEAIEDVGDKIAR
jgi:uncharacterized protein YjbJ (UPF0337 family)